MASTSSSPLPRRQHVLNRRVAHAPLGGITLEVRTTHGLDADVMKTIITAQQPTPVTYTRTAVTNNNNKRPLTISPKRNIPTTTTTHWKRPNMVNPVQQHPINAPATTTLSGRRSQAPRAAPAVYVNPIMIQIRRMSRIGGGGGGGSTVDSLSPVLRSRRNGNGGVTEDTSFLGSPTLSPHRMTAESSSPPRNNNTLSPLRQKSRSRSLHRSSFDDMQRHHHLLVPQDHEAFLIEMLRQRLHIEQVQKQFLLKNLKMDGFTNETELQLRIRRDYPQWAADLERYDNDILDVKRRLAVLLAHNRSTTVTTTTAGATTSIPSPPLPPPHSPPRQVSTTVSSSLHSSPSSPPPPPPPPPTSPPTALQSSPTKLRRGMVSGGSGALLLKSITSGSSGGGSTVVVTPSSTLRRLLSITGPFKIYASNDDASLAICRSLGGYHVARPISLEDLSMPMESTSTLVGRVEAPCVLVINPKAGADALARNLNIARFGFKMAYDWIAMEADSSESWCMNTLLWFQSHDDNNISRLQGALLMSFAEHLLHRVSTTQPVEFALLVSLLQYFRAKIVFWTKETSTTPASWGPSVVATSCLGKLERYLISVAESATTSSPPSPSSSQVDSGNKRLLVSSSPAIKDSPHVRFMRQAEEAALDEEKMDVARRALRDLMHEWQTATTTTTTADHHVGNNGAMMNEDGLTDDGVPQSSMGFEPDYQDWLERNSVYVMQVLQIAQQRGYLHPREPGKQVVLDVDEFGIPSIIPITVYVELEETLYRSTDEAVESKQMARNAVFQGIVHTLVKLFPCLVETTDEKKFQHGSFHDFVVSLRRPPDDVQVLHGMVFENLFKWDLMDRCIVSDGGNGNSVTWLIFPNEAERWKASIVDDMTALEKEFNCEQMEAAIVFDIADWIIDQLAGEVAMELEGV